jgi:hypothetical protein
MEYLWDLYSVRITIKMADEELIFGAVPYLACQLMVRKVVPTLTSKSAEIYFSMAGAKQCSDTSLSWFRPWAVRPIGVRSRRCIALHCSACRGELQARRERRGSLQVPEVCLRRSANIVDSSGNMQVCSYLSSLAARGLAPPFIGQGKAVYSHAAQL